MANKEHDAVFANENELIVSNIQSSLHFQLSPWNECIRLIRLLSTEVDPDKREPNNQINSKKRKQLSLARSTGLLRISLTETGKK